MYVFNTTAVPRTVPHAHLHACTAHERAVPDRC